MAGSRVAHATLKGPSVVKELCIGMALALAAGSLWKMHHWNEQRKVRQFYDLLEKGEISVVLHFEKTLEKKRSIDLQKKELHKLFQLFFIFLGLVFLAQAQSPRLQCRHCWVPITLLSLSHLIFYVSVAQTLRCINGFKYQRRCHKLTLGLATEKLREMKIRASGAAGGGDHFEGVGDDEFEIHYQEPPESYFGKFKRNWALHFGFLILIYGFMVSSSVVLLCF
nr:cytochrome c oxidase subunit 5c [Quercus suber]